MNINIRIQGEGIPLIFFHGFMEDHEMWNFIPTLFPKHKIICVDLPGHGLSDPIPTPFDLKYITLEVYKAIKHDCSEKPILIGHSLGGYIGLEWILLQLPLQKLILMHSHPFADSPQKKEDRIRMSEMILQNKESVIKIAIPNLFVDKENNKSAVQETIKTALKCDEKSISNYSLAMKNRPDYSILEPVLNQKINIIHGEQDQIIPGNELIQWSEKNQKKVYLIPNTGHMSHLEKSLELQSVLKDAIEF